MMDNQPITNIVKIIAPAVISIIITKDLPKVEGFYNMPLRGRNFLIPKIKKGVTESVKIGGGSGFLVSENGFILTNSHVVKDPKADYTVLLDHEEASKRKMQVIARDPIHDIAICKIKGKGFHFLELGDSGNLQLGEMVLAVGNALGEFSNTVSLGIISGLSRFITAQQGNGDSNHMERLRGLIQTDAAINLGNSGGPLINMHAKVIGINTAVIFGAQNIGFSIPINHAKKDIMEVKEHGRIRLPFIGVRYILLDQNIQKQNKLPVDYGALIMREMLGDVAVISNSSAAKAGLKEFDIILEADGKKITTKNTLQDIIQEHEIGDKINLKILRDKKEISMKLTLEEKRT